MIEAANDLSGDTPTATATFVHLNHRASRCVQQQSTAVSPLLSAVQRGSPTLTAPQRGLARSMPSLCKQGVRGSSPLGSTISPCQRHFLHAKELSKTRIQQQSTATVPARDDARSGFEPLAERLQRSQSQLAQPAGGGHLGQRVEKRRPCGWHAPSSLARRPV
jgi:hypothetical protein